MKVIAELIGMVKINTKGFCKVTIENFTMYWTRGSYLVLRSKPMVPRNIPLIAIGYRYNARKVVYFIVTEYTGRINTVSHYLSKYNDQFTNVVI